MQFGVGHVFAAVRGPALFGDTPALTIAASEAPLCEPFPNFPPRAPCPFGLVIVSGVGHNEKPVTSVRRTNGGSGNAVPFSVIPARGQVSENSVNPPNKQSCDVLHDDVARS